MRDKARKAYALACFVLAFAGIVLLIALIAPSPTGRSGDARGAGRAAGTNLDLFTIEGDAVEPISPGVMVPLDLAFTNAQPVAVSLVTVTVTVRGVDAPRADHAHPCTVADFAVQQAPDPLGVTLAARTTRSLSRLGVEPAGWPQVGMLNRPVNQDGCKGSTVTLGYTATATTVRQ